MEDTPKFVPKFSFNSAKMNVLGYQTKSCSWYSVKVTIVAIFRFYFFIGAIDSFVKCLHIFYQFFTCSFNEIICKTLRLAGTFIYTVI